jgi:signal transduction histidine kinase
MILFISPYQNATDCATLIERATHQQVKTVDSIRLAMASLRTHEFTAVVADENLLECSPGSAEALVQRMQSATPIFLDMAYMRVERIGKFVELAVRRRELEYKALRELAIAELHSELKSEVTGLLITSELALKAPSVSAALSERLTAVLESAKRIRAKLEK